MIRKKDFTNTIEHCDYHISSRNGRKYRLKWKSTVSIFYTCGRNNYEVECLKMIPGSLEIQLLNEQGNDLREMTIDEFNQQNELEQINFRCNCHGFTFANGKFCITNFFVNNILDAEYEEVTNAEETRIGDFDIVCFKSQDSGEWIHSCKYEYELFIQKEGIRKFTVHTNIQEIINIKEYKNSGVHYFKKRQRSCPGVCLNAIGEPHIKTFANVST